MDKIVIGIFAIVGIVFVVAIFGLLMAFPVMWCWNYTMPYLFGLKAIAWGQAWCLYFLAGCLLRSSSTSNSS